MAINNIVQINKNILKSATFHVDFFDLREYDLLENDFTMYLFWVDFINSTPKFTVPILRDGIEVIEKTNNLFFRNEIVQDNTILSLDNSEEYNLMNFIENGVSAKDVDLDDLIYLGAIFRMEYIDLFGNTQKDNITVGRVSLSKFSDKVLKINIDPFNNILKGSQFESNVMNKPSGSFYNYISLEQAYSNVFNVPHNQIDDDSYPITPFSLNKDNYVESDNKDVIITDGNFPIGKNYSVYAEDTVSNTNEYIHTQFFYDDDEPACGVKLTKYTSEGDEIESEYSLVQDWNVWSNTIDADNKYSIKGYYRDTILQYARFFRPFKVVVAGDEEVAAFNSGNYRLVREINLDVTSVSPNQDPSLYEPQIENTWWRQVKVTAGKYAPSAGDRLIYFEQCGDVKPYDFVNEVEETINLYDNSAHIYVYNMDKDIVYFNHIANLVQTSPLPSQWLDLQEFISTRRIRFSSRQDYTSSNNDYQNWFSRVKPMCGIGENRAVASTRSFKNNQNSDGTGGNFEGEKQYNLFALGSYNIDVAADKAVLTSILDNYTRDIKPKFVRISDNGKKIYFTRNVRSQFDSWVWENAFQVNISDYKTTDEFPRAMKLCKKDLYITVGDETKYSQREYDFYKWVAWSDSESAFTPVMNEIPDLLTNETVLLENIIQFNDSGNYTTKESQIRKVSTGLFIGSKFLLSVSELQPAVNFFSWSTDIYYCALNKVYKNSGTLYSYDLSWKTLDYNFNENRLIVQKSTELAYYDTENDVNIESKEIVGYSYLLSMTRDRFLLTNPTEGKSDEVLRIGSVINEPVRLLSYSGNRFQAATGLANTFFKNMNYDNNGILKIGFTENKENIHIFDSLVTGITSTKTKYDIIEWEKQQLEKNNFSSVDNDKNTNREEDDNTFDSDVSLAMWSDRDVQLNISIERITTTTIKWSANNEHGREEGEFEETNFTLFNFGLSGDFAGITIFANFYNTFLNVGDKFSGKIDRRYLQSTGTKDKIVSSKKDYLFVDNRSLQIKPSFLYKEHSEAFLEQMSLFFMSGDNVKSLIIYDVIIPEMIIFDENYKVLNVGDIALFSSNVVETSGFKDCFIERIAYLYSQKITKLKLITLE